MITPHRVRIARDASGHAAFPQGAVRVDRTSKWWPPFGLDHPYLARRSSAWVSDRQHQLWLLSSMYREWITGALVDNPMWWLMTPEADRRSVCLPPSIDEIKHALRGRTLADWPPIGWPCIGDVLLSIANQASDGTPFPTPSDGFRPRHKPMTRSQHESARRQVTYLSTVFGR